jgi:hypothetical protein
MDNPSPVSSSTATTGTSSSCNTGTCNHNNDEELRKLLKPLPTDEDVMDIVRRYYCNGGGNSIDSENNDATTTTTTMNGERSTGSHDHDVQIIRQLDSYDDCNYQVMIQQEMYLFKISNGIESPPTIVVLVVPVVQVSVVAVIYNPPLCRRRRHRYCIYNIPLCILCIRMVSIPIYPSDQGGIQPQRTIVRMIPNMSYYSIYQLLRRNIVPIDWRYGYSLGYMDNQCVPYHIRN